MTNILVIGSGGREHALAWQLRSSKNSGKIFVAPGNAGTGSIAINVDIAVNEFDKLGQLVLENNIDLVVVGPESPLVEGLVDYFQEHPDLRNKSVVGPGLLGAMLEGSKDFAKKFMASNNIPTAASATFTSDNISDGIAFLDTLKPPFVLKADGLAAGKGVVICPTKEEAVLNLEQMLINKKFGKASSKVVIEEYLHGIELSVFVLADGRNYKILPEAKDYKRIGDNDTGPNTGGMGSVSPVAFANAEFMKKVEERVVKPTINGLLNEKIDYKGFIFIGLMNVDGNPYVIEYNVRMGDPETQVVIPRIENDFVELMLATAQGRLDKIDLKIDPRTAATVVMVSGGYPDAYEKGKEITGLDKVGDSLIFHAGTKRNMDGITITDGGRVLAVATLAENLPSAIELTYQAVGNINWDGVYYRKDIGQDLMKISISS
jgi:phosphoribosylamine---glycine ligase